MRPRFSIVELNAIIDALEFALAGEISGGPFDPSDGDVREGSAKWNQRAGQKCRVARSASEKAKEMIDNRRASK